jgi:KaiC/GvpD/RAD55 family RecA-like ATPase
VEHKRGGTPLMDALGQCIDFLGAIFEPEDIIEYRPLPPAAGRRWAPLTELPDIVDWLERINKDENQRVHAYFGANPRKAKNASQAEGVALARCLFADFDGGVVVEDALARVRASGFPMPTAIVESGGGVHVWWRLLEPMTDATAWHERMRAISSALGSDQSICDWPRIMRLPGFVNWKYEQTPRAHLWDCDPTRIYPVDVFNKQAVQSIVVKPKSMSDLTRRFLEEGFTLAAGRRQTMFTVACDMAARGWGVAEATNAIMERMRRVGLRQDDLEDCPRQIANAWKRTRLPVLGSADEAVAIVDAIDETPTPTLLDAIDAWRKQEETPAIPTGLPCLDKLFDGGLPLGQMTALAAAPGVGKSALALHLVIQCLLRNPEMVAAWCLGEMTRAALASRAITNYGGMVANVTLQEVIKKRDPSDQIATELGQRIGGRLKLIDAPLVVDKIERAVVKDKPALLVIDYLQLVRATRHFQDKTGEINDVLLKLREITTSRNIATLLVTNIAKGCDANTEIGNIGKGSNQIDFDVDNFLFGHRAGEIGPDGELKIEWRCKKLRQGQMADVELWFHGRFQYFEDAIEIPEFSEFANHAPQQDWGAV